MIYALLPVSLYRVHYQLGYGRPYSQLDRLVLQAVHDGTNQLDCLCALFKIHRRIMIEVLVTLIRAGWIGISSVDSALTCTRFGKAALGKEVLPQDSIVEPKELNIVLEKVGGQICTGGQVTFFDRRNFKDIEHQTVILQKADVSNVLTSGMVIPFLYREQGSWIRNIGPIKPVRDNADFILVKVDTERQEIYGVPEEWKPLLTFTALDRAERKEAELMERQITVDNSKPDLLYREASGMMEIASWAIGATGKDIAINQRGTLAIQKYAATNCPEYFLMITATCISDPTMISTIRTMLEGNTSVDLVLPPVADRKEREALVAHLTDGLSKSSAERLYVAEMPCDIPFTAILIQTDTGVSADILLPIGGSTHGTLININHAGLLSDLCRMLADFISLHPEMRIGSATIRLRNYSSELSRVQSLVPRSTTHEIGECRILFGRQNIVFVHQLLKRAQRTVVLVDPGCQARSNGGIFPVLSRLLKEKSLGIKVVFKTLAESNDANALYEYEKLGGVIDQRDDTQSITLMIDDHLFCATTIPILSGDLGVIGEISSSLGVYFNGREIVREILSVTSNWDGCLSQSDDLVRAASI